MEKDKINNIIRLLITILLVVIFSLSVVSLIQKIAMSKVEEVSYNEFINLVNKNKVESVKINFISEKFLFKTKDKVFKTDNPKDDSFKKFLLKKDIDVSVVSISTMEVLLQMCLLLPRVFVFMFLIKIIIDSMGRFEKKKTLVVDVPDVTFNNIAGYSEPKKDMEFLIKFLKNPHKYYKMGAKLPKGIILYGPPGTGKTLVAKAIAGEAGVPFFSVSGSDFVEMYVGLGAKRVRGLFEDARKNAPCIVFIDEIDAIGTKRGGYGGNSEKDQTINALLAELDGFDTREPIIVIAATNRVEDLDPALIRPGRFDRHIAVNLPDKRERLEILKIYVKNKEIDKDVCLEELAELTIGFSGAGLEALINEATIIAVNNGANIVRKKDIDDAYFKIVMKGHKKNNKKNIDKKEKKLIAYHEAGHALCAKLLTNNSVPKVTIIPSTSGAGGATFNIPQKLGLFSKKEILNEIKVLYGGRVAEYMLTEDENEITTGASQDIKQATKYIKKYFNEFGMSEKFGMLNLDVLDKAELSLGVEEAIKLSNKLYKETLELLKNNKDKLDEIAKELIEKETLNEKDLDRIIFN